MSWPRHPPPRAEKGWPGWLSDVLTSGAVHPGPAEGAAARAARRYPFSTGPPSAVPGFISGAQMGLWSFDQTNFPFLVPM